jgi:hypothetical protein
MYLRVLTDAGGNVGDECELLRVRVDRINGIRRIDDKKRTGGRVEKERAVLDGMEAKHIGDRSNIRA